LVSTLTLSELAYDIFIPRFWPKTSSFWLPYQCHSSSASLRWRAVQWLKQIGQSSGRYSKKIFLVGGADLCEWHHKWNSFGAILAHFTWPRAQPL